MNHSEIREQMENLYLKDQNFAHVCFKNLREESGRSDGVYSCFEQMAGMLEDDNSFVRTRGLVLIADNARWDSENKIDEIIDEYLKHIEDEKPITARQCIKALPDLVRWKPDLGSIVCEALRRANPGRYKDSMSGLVQGDIAVALNTIEGGKK